MDEKSFYRAEIARMRAEDPSGNAETIRMMEQELLELELAEQGIEGELTRRRRENAEIIRRAEEKHAAEERAEPASEGRTSRLETIGGEEYDPFADWLNGGKEYGRSRAGRLGIDRHGEIYAREGESELDRKLLGLKWAYEQEPERREEIAAEAEVLRREHPGEYTVTAERPLADYLLIDTPNEAYFEERPDRRACAGALPGGGGTEGQRARAGLLGRGGGAAGGSGALARVCAEAGGAGAAAVPRGGAD